MAAAASTVDADTIPASQEISQSPEQVFAALVSEKLVPEVLSLGGPRQYLLRNLKTPEDKAAFARYLWRGWGQS